MKEILEDAKKDALHHAYAIEGDPEGSLSSLFQALEEALHIHVQGNPDVYSTVVETLPIEESRTVSRVASTKPLAGGKKIIILGFYSATTEAQNALLKILEEPAEGTHFFLIVPNVHMLLPTIRSRVQIIQSSGGIIDEALVNKFLSATPAERIRLLQGVIDSQNKSSAVSFLNGLEQSLRTKNNLTQVGVTGIAVFDEIRRARDHIEDRSSSVKMSLEHIAVVVPPQGFLAPTT